MDERKACVLVVEGEPTAIAWWIGAARLAEVEVTMFGARTSEDEFTITTFGRKP